MSYNIVTIKSDGSPIHVVDDISGNVINVQPCINLINDLITDRKRGEPDIDSLIGTLGEYSSDLMNLVTMSGPDGLEHAAKLQHLLNTLKTHIESMKV